MNDFNNYKKLFPSTIHFPIYELINKLDNKTTSLFIPDGNKYFVWFTKYNNNLVCLFWDKNENNNIIFEYACFSEELTKGIGTIAYGTLKDKSFYCELLYYFKGQSITGSYMDRFIMLKNMFQYLHSSNFSNTIHFYLPFMSNTKFIFESTNIPYKTNTILQFDNNKIKCLNLEDYVGSFKILKRKEYEDVYELWNVNNNGTFEFYSTALVNDLKTSNFLKNDIFNLNINYINSQFLNETILEELEWNFYKNDFFVGCIFIPEFRKWKPIIKKSNADILKSIQYLEKKILC